MASDYTLHMRPVFSAHPVPREHCEHSSTSALVLGLKTDRKGISVRATLCMDCGHETTGQMHPWQAVSELWREYGWHMQIARRLMQLSKRCARQARREGNQYAAALLAAFS